MSSKMIGLVIASMDSETTLDLYRGIRQQARQYGYSTQGYVIYPSQISSPDYNNNEFFMLETIDYSAYDGLIVALDTISSEETKQIIRENLQKASIPMIAIDCEIPNSYKINTSNYEAVKNLVLHMARQHGRTKINYISGPASNAESNLRLTAYQHAMTELGLSSEDRVFEGDFFVDDGRNGLNYFNSSAKGNDYDAILCGNDMAGISTICELIKDGKRVPEDVVVAGFDNISESTRIIPNLTTISKNSHQIGQFAVDLLKKVWEGESVPEITKVPAKIIYRASCGCVDWSNQQETALHNYVETFSFTKLFQEYNRSFMENGIGCTNFEEFLALIKEFVIRIYPGQFSIHIHEKYAKLFEIEDYPSILVPNKDGTKSLMYNILFFVNGQFLPLENLSNKPTVSFNPHASKNAFTNLPPVQFLNSPLHFHGEKIGFVMFGDSDFPTLPGLYYNWLNTMNVTFNNVYSKMLLTQLYRTDSLTGAYNRFGMTYYWNRFLAISTAMHTDINIIFADLNGLKLINDIYGHEAGDFSISYVAEVMKSKESSKLKAIRYGGDEFLLLGVGFCREEVDAIVTDMEADMEAKQRKLGKPYHMSASFGVYMRSPESTLDIEECIKEADGAMYQQKRKMKSGLPSKPGPKK